MNWFSSGRVDTFRFVRVRWGTWTETEELEGIIGGTLDGYEGRLMTTRGSKVKRLLVELKGFLAVGVDVNPEYIRIVR